MLSMRVVASALMALAGTAAFGAEPLPPGYVPPDWLKKPGANSLMQVWPTEALKTGSSGKAKISCQITAQGSLTGCKVLSESPEGAGFGQAAIALTPQFLMRPATQDGKPVPGGEVRIPINFVWPAGSPGVSSVNSRAVVTKVNWLSAPSYADMTAAFPEKARKNAVGGAATLACDFDGSGGLKDCRTISETPFAMGFGAAAKTLAPRFRGPTSFGDGKSTKGAGAHVRFTFPVEMLSAAPQVVGKPDWTALPGADALASAIPQAALKADVKTARVVLDCGVVTGGKLDTCKVESETPAGYGFGASTLALSESFRMTIWSDEGLPAVGGRIRIPVRYNVPDADPSPAAKP